MPARRVGDGDRIEVRGFQYDVGRRSTDLGGGATHHAADRDRPASVRDDDVGGIQRALDTVESADALAGGGSSYDDVAGQLRVVEGMQRLTEIEHHVVGDIDGQRDRTHTGEGEPPLQPRRAGRLRVQARDDAGDVAVTAGRVVDAYRIATAVRRRHVDV